MVQMVFETHFYRWDGRIFHQARGGPIGLRLSGVIAKVAMECWLAKMSSRMEKFGMRKLLLYKYMDKVLIVCEVVSLGMDLVDRKLRHNVCLEEKQRSMGVKESEATFEILN